MLDVGSGDDVAVHHRRGAADIGRDVLEDLDVFGNDDRALGSELRHGDAAREHARDARADCHRFSE